MKSFSVFLENTPSPNMIRPNQNIVVWHGTKSKFNLPFDETRLGSANDMGYSGRGFYFSPTLEYAKYAAASGFVKQFGIKVVKAFYLDSKSGKDIFADINTPRERDKKTLELLKQGYNITYRTIGGKLDEICVLSYKAMGFDGNRWISDMREMWTSF